jgi:predicted metal-dependent peptidase
MSDIIKKKSKKVKNKKHDNLIGPTDPKIDEQARERLINARVGLLICQPFYGNLATRLKLVNADEWCGTAATDGLNFYYNSRFIMKLKHKEVEFLFGHEVLHVVYDHIGRRDERDPQLWNIANDYAVNADLKRYNIGEFITTVSCLYDAKYEGKTSEDIYDDLMKNAKTVNMDDLIDQLLDEHMDENDEEGKNRPDPMSAEERERLRQEIKRNIISAAQSVEAGGAGSVPNNVKRMIQELTEPKMPWRELIPVNLNSAIRSDYSFMRPSRRGWHMDAIMPGMNPGETIDIVVALDMSGSIGQEDAKAFLSEIGGMMDMFTSYKIHVFCFDTEAYNPQDFTSDNMDTIETYEPQGGGGTDFSAIFGYLRDNAIEPNRLIVFTDGMPYGTWGDENYCDTTWIIHGSNTIKPPFGQYAYYDDHKKKR